MFIYKLQEYLLVCNENLILKVYEGQLLITKKNSYMQETEEKEKSITATLTP